VAGLTSIVASRRTIANRTVENVPPAGWPSRNIAGAVFLARGRLYEVLALFSAPGGCPSALFKNGDVTDVAVIRPAITPPSPYARAEQIEPLESSVMSPALVNLL
jgi:hypothetical protein